MVEWLEQALQWHEAYGHDLEVVSLNPSWIELGVRSTSVPSRTWTKNILFFGHKSAATALTSSSSSPPPSSAPPWSLQIYKETFTGWRKWNCYMVLSMPVVMREMEKQRKVPDSSRQFLFTWLTQNSFTSSVTMLSLTSITTPLLPMFYIPETLLMSPS